MLASSHATSVRRSGRPALPAGSWQSSAVAIDLEERRGQH
jgi:hypothetical protein